VWNASRSFRRRKMADGTRPEIREELAKMQREGRYGMGGVILRGQSDMIAFLIASLRKL